MAGIIGQRFGQGLKIMKFAFQADSLPGAGKGKRVPAHYLFHPVNCPIFQNRSGMTQVDAFF
jgi:hypothetical protein